MRRLTSAQKRYLRPGIPERTTPVPAPTAESKARGERRRKIEAITEDRDREAELDHFDDADGLPVVEL